MRLTRRQQDFLRNLLDLYHETKQPIHYTRVAESLGVNRFSAYDMLKLLEQKGYVHSEYVLAQSHSGPGRSSIAFLPTPKARAAVRLFAGQANPNAEWQAVRERILKRLRERDLNDDSLLTELITHVPSVASPVEFCAEAATALILNLNALTLRARDFNPRRALAALAPSGHIGLGALAGLSIGSALTQELDRAVLERLLSLTRRFQADLATLSDEHLRNLSDLVDEALETVTHASLRTRQP
jgi:DNA-binding MarR family transcriptional regulator